jgi:hypothetical protein
MMRGWDQHLGGRQQSGDGKEPGVRIQRLLDGPIISADLHPSIGSNIQGPSIIRAPDWIEGRLGDYYLYFADHKGRYIRLAYTDNLLGPWRIHPPGSLQLEQSCFLTKPPTVTPEQLAQFETRLIQSGVAISHDLLLEITTPHIASPDVRVDVPGRRIVMYFHGLEAVGTQVTRVATSPNGIDFNAQPEVLGRPYMRSFQHDDMTYAMAMPGQFYRSKDGMHRFETRSDFVQSKHAAFGGAETWRRAMGVLDPGWRGARTNSAEPNRPRRRLA